MIYYECLFLLYGTNTFSITITYDGIRFRYSWLLPNGLRPNLTYDYLDFFPQRTLGLIKKYVITVEHVDSYKGMIKYNCAGIGLSEGVRGQVKRLVEELKTVHGGLAKLTVRLEGNKVLDAIRKRAVRAMEKFGEEGVMQSVLEPFGELQGVGTASVGGNVESAYAKRLEASMTRPS